MNTNDTSVEEIQKVLTGLSYPISKQDLLKQAKNRKVSKETMSAINGLLNKQYNNSEDVLNVLEGRDNTGKEGEETGGDMNKRGGQDEW